MPQASARTQENVIIAILGALVVQMVINTINN